MVYVVLSDAYIAYMQTDVTLIFLGECFMSEDENKILDIIRKAIQEAEENEEGCRDGIEWDLKQAGFEVIGYLQDEYDEKLAEEQNAVAQFRDRYVVLDDAGGLKFINKDT